MPGPPEDWGGVVERVLAGDPGALARVNRLVTGVLTHLRAYDFRDAWDDVRQEVLAAVVANARAGRLRDPAAFVAYVRAIARNKVMDQLKAHLRCRPGETTPWEDVAETLPAAEDDPRVREVWAAAETLSADERRVLDGLYREGRTYEEVAVTTGIPLGTLKRRLRDALETLRRRLAG